MADAYRDGNRVPALIAVSDADGSTLVAIKADPTAHTLNVSDGTTGSDLSGDDALRDSNRITGLLAVSDADGETPVPVYADPSTGALLIDST